MGIVAGYEVFDFRANRTLGKYLPTQRQAAQRRADRADRNYGAMTACVKIIWM